MATKIRLARGGAKKRPFYRIVVADERAPRDGKFIEKIGTYNPMLPKESAERVKYDVERLKYWLGTGAQPTEAIERFLRKDGVITTKPKYTPKAKIEKLAPRAQARKEAEEAAKAEAEASLPAEVEAAENAEANADAETTPAEDTAKEAAQEDAAPAEEEAKSE